MFNFVNDSQSLRVAILHCLFTISESVSVAPYPHQQLLLSGFGILAILKGKPQCLPGALICNPPAEHLLYVGWSSVGRFGSFY